MNTFDLQRNDGTWELTNISSSEAKDIRFQLNRIMLKEKSIRIQQPQIEVSGIESLRPGETASLKFADKLVSTALIRTETDEKLNRREIGDRGFCLHIFFEHPLEASQSIRLWEIP